MASETIDSCCCLIWKWVRVVVEIVVVVVHCHCRLVVVVVWPKSTRGISRGFEYRTEDWR